MEDSEMTPLAAALDRRIEETETVYHRPLYSELDWDDRLVCIKGAKGTGKTTMMLQFLKEHPEELSTASGSPTTARLRSSSGCTTTATSGSSSTKCTTSSRGRR